MNKIVIDEDIIKIADVSNSIEIEYFKSVNFFGLNEIKLNIIKNSKLMLEINTLDNTKFNLNFNINSDVEFDLIIKTSGNNSKMASGAAWGYASNNSGVLQNGQCGEEKVDKVVIKDGEVEKVIEVEGDYLVPSIYS